MLGMFFTQERSRTRRSLRRSPDDSLPDDSPDRERSRTPTPLRRRPDRRPPLPRRRSFLYRSSFCSSYSISAISIYNTTGYSILIHLQLQAILQSLNQLHQSPHTMHFLPPDKLPISPSPIAPFSVRSKALDTQPSLLRTKSLTPKTSQTSPQIQSLSWNHSTHYRGYTSTFSASSPSRGHRSPPTVPNPKWKIRKMPKNPWLEGGNPCPHRMLNPALNIPMSVYLQIEMIPTNLNDLHQNCHCKRALVYSLSKAFRRSWQLYQAYWTQFLSSEIMHWWKALQMNLYLWTTQRWKARGRNKPQFLHERCATIHYQQEVLQIDMGMQQYKFLPLHQRLFYTNRSQLEQTAPVILFSRLQHSWTTHDRQWRPQNLRVQNGQNGYDCNWHLALHSHHCRGSTNISKNFTLQEKQTLPLLPTFSCAKTSSSTFPSFTSLCSFHFSTQHHIQFQPIEDMEAMKTQFLFEVIVKFSFFHNYMGQHTRNRHQLSSCFSWLAQSNLSRS